MNEPILNGAELFGAWVLEALKEEGAGFNGFIGSSGLTEEGGFAVEFLSMGGKSCSFLKLEDELVF